MAPGFLRRRCPRPCRGRRLQSSRPRRLATQGVRISLVLDIGQGAGLAGATGVRPFLPPLLAGALARGDTGIDFERGDFAFLESPVFLLVVLALAVAAYLAERRGHGGAPDERATAARNADAGGRRRAREPVDAAFGAIAVALGALLFAGSLAGGGSAGWPGLIAGAACAALGYLAVAALFAAARRRVDAGAAALLTAQADLLALVLAGLAIFVEPVGYLAVAVFVFLIVRARGARGGKYEGLRILR